MMATKTGHVVLPPCDADRNPQPRANRQFSSFRTDSPKGPPRTQPPRKWALRRVFQIHNPWIREPRKDFHQSRKCRDTARMPATVFTSTWETTIRAQINTLDISQVQPNHHNGAMATTGIASRYQDGEMILSRSGIFPKKPQDDRQKSIRSTSPDDFQQGERPALRNKDPSAIGASKRNTTSHGVGR